MSERSISISNVSGSNIAIGNNNSIVSFTSNSPADPDELKRQIEALRAQVKQAAPPEKQAMALGMVDELAAAGAAPKQNEGTINFVRQWFLRNLPGLAGAVSSLIVGPIGGKLVEAVGEGLAGEVERRMASDGA
jgi:hypothetical protein